MKRRPDSCDGGMAEVGASCSTKSATGAIYADTRQDITPSGMLALLRSRMAQGLRTAWPPSAALEGGAHKLSAVGGIAPKGRTGPKSLCRRRSNSDSKQVGRWRSRGALK